MRLSSICPIASWTLVWIAVLALVSPAALAQDDEATDVASAPLAAVSGADEEEERCELITARRGESAEVVEEKTRERGEEFPYLASQEGLLREFQVDEDERRACAAAFGLAYSGGAAQAGAALGAGFGATLAGAGVATAVGAGILVTAGGVLAISAAGGGGGGNNTIPATSTPTGVTPE